MSPQNFVKTVIFASLICGSGAYGAQQLDSKGWTEERKEATDYLPIVKVHPQYPRRALSRGFTGYVFVEFTVTELGRVKDPVVIENCAFVKQNNRQKGENCSNSPNKIFDKSALKAARKFLYKPKERNGTPVQTKGVQNKITFDLYEG